MNALNLARRPACPGSKTRLTSYHRHSFLPTQAAHSRRRRHSRPAVMTLEWQEIATAEGDRPRLARSGHVLAALPPSHSHDALLFGGYTEAADKSREAANDAWVLSLARGKWEALATEGPSPRVRLASAGVVVGNNFWLIAGWDPGHKRDGGEILSDVWRLDLSTRRWTEVKPQGQALQPISRFQAVPLGDSEIVIHTHRSLGDVLVLDVRDPEAPVLSQRPVAGEGGATPTSRGLQSLTAVGERLVLFGGAPKEGPMLGDLWCLEKNEWREIDPEGRAPHVRCSQAAAAHGQDVFMLGGSYYKEDGSGLQPLNDLLALDTATWTWRYPRLGGAGPRPSPRNAAAMVAVGSRLVLYGGWWPFKESYNDTYVLDVSGYDALRADSPLEPQDDGAL